MVDEVFNRALSAPQYRLIAAQKHKILDALQRELKGNER